MICCRPPRYKHHHDFYIRMEIRNLPYFHEIRFRMNSGDIVPETEGDVRGGIGGAVLAGVLQGAGISALGAQTNTSVNFSEKRRDAECVEICKKIVQAVEDGKRAPNEGGKFRQYGGNKL